MRELPSRRSPVSQDGGADASAPLLAYIAAPETLREAWRRVRANKGRPGPDGVTIEAFGREVEERLQRLGATLLRETYRPGPLLRTTIAKADGGRRRLAIPNVVDRVAQTAALIVLGPELDRRLSEGSFAYRTGRNVDGAIAAVEAAFAEGRVWTLDADVASFFDRVRHRRLLDELAIWIADEAILRLFSRWLRTFSRWGRGIAQGSPISPLLANLFLHPLDRLIGARGHVIVRYADDFVVLAASRRELDRARILTIDVLRRRGLRLNDLKTQAVPPGTSFVFLGRELIAPPPTATGHAAT